MNVVRYNNFIRYEDIGSNKFPHLFEMLRLHSFSSLYDRGDLTIWETYYENGAPFIYNNENGTFYGIVCRWWLEEQAAKDDSLLAEYAILRMQRG